MRTIRYTKQFKRDYRREKKSPHYRRTLDDLLSEITRLLASDTPLLPSHRDHPLVNNWKDHRDCHIRPDLILIYRKPNHKTLELIRLGSHSQLGL